jgi:hypothetical protein
MVSVRELKPAEPAAAVLTNTTYVPGRALEDALMTRLLEPVPGMVAGLSE